MSGRSDSERLSVLEQRFTDHESRCEERLSEIRTSAAETLKAVEALKNRGLAIVLSLLAWALVQLWSANEARIADMKTVAEVQQARLTPASPT